MQMLASPPQTRYGDVQSATTPTTAADTLFAWVAAVCGGRIVHCMQTAGGNRCHSWAIDVTDDSGTVSEVFLRYAPPRPPGVEPYTVHREAQVYRAIAAAGLQAPRLIAEHPHLEAVLTSRSHGIAEFRRLVDPAAKQAIIGELMDNLARLHRTDVTGLMLDGGTSGARIADHVRAELGIWRAMYEESARPDALIDLGLRWLDTAMPDPDGPVVLAHGDAGPGNFLFEHGRLTALIDWELAHLGDPMEDLAWLSMRCVMEPVPDFTAALRDYERFAGTPVDRARVLYHRVFVSTRVVIIRHRNVTGEPAHAIVSRALNRRLLIEALAEASGTTIEKPAPIELTPTPRAALYEQVLTDLRDVVVARSTDGQVIAKAKNAAKVIKYLQAHDRLGQAIESADRQSLSALLNTPVTDLQAGEQVLTAALQAGRIQLPAALYYFAGQAARQAQLAAAASGGIASRHYPALPA